MHEYIAHKWLFHFTTLLLLYIDSTGLDVFALYLREGLLNCSINKILVLDDYILCHTLSYFYHLDRYHVSFMSL